jgi:signal transduction histidine kinase
LAAGLAHTVNNALTGTIGNLELALRRLPPDTREAREVEAALACAHRAAEAVRQVVAFVTTTPQVPCEQVSLSDVARSAAQTARTSLARDVVVVLSADRPVRIAGQAALLTTAVEQIVRNALEAMPQHGRLTLETEEARGRCRLWIRDTGPGLPPEVQARLFEPFVTTKSFGHLGLGLHLASELVRAQNGTLNLSSSPGIGTTVLFSFPALTPADHEPRTAPRIQEASSFSQ